jgi:nucleotide-binding universal stress UspA family protein
VTAPRPLTLVVGVDGSECSLRAVRYALHMCAEATDARLVLCNAQPALTYAETLMGVREVIAPHWSGAAGHEALREALALALAAGRQPRVEILAGEPAAAIAAEAHRCAADLVLVGAHGLGGARELVVGSVARRLLEAAPCAVVVAP